MRAFWLCVLAGRASGLRVVVLACLRVRPRFSRCALVGSRRASRLWLFAFLAHPASSLRGVVWSANEPTRAHAACASLRRRRLAFLVVATGSPVGLWVSWWRWSLYFSLADSGERGVSFSCSHGARGPARPAPACGCSLASPAVRRALSEDLSLSRAQALDQLRRLPRLVSDALAVSGRVTAVFAVRPCG